MFNNQGFMIDKILNQSYRNYKHNTKLMNLIIRINYIT